jgi:hypothetical protein
MTISVRRATLVACRSRSTACPYSAKEWQAVRRGRWLQVELHSPRQLAEYQGRPIDELGGASTFSDEERAALIKALGIAFVLSLIGMGLASGD